MSEEYPGLTYREAGGPAPSYARLKDDGNPYRNLANAIVCVAADDYRKAIREGNDELRDAVLEFFYSPYFRFLTEASPTYILKRIGKEDLH